ncbi:Hypothetical protein A7982_00257 [Minicystis rosea]|nr:Hypothetical protein A7982_00257 [Minicystis rosea]
MSRVAAVAVMTAVLSIAVPASAENPPSAPDAARVRTAAEQFDAGVNAYKAKDYEGAASHFEAADAAVPSAKSLRQAIRARAEAGHASRAATHAGQALLKYPSDEATAKLARETIEKFAPQLHKVSVSCASPCVLAVGTRSIPGDASTRWVVYLDPGKESVSASFFGGAGSKPRSINAKAGGSDDVRFEPEEKAAPPVVAPVVGAPALPKNDAPPPSKEAPEPEAKGISPAFFGVALAATAGLGATTIWSGVDTQTNPGPDAVKAACQGKGPECPLYQQGLDKQRRTNILIGATAGTAAVTVVLAVFTRWRSPKKAAQASTLLDPSGRAAEPGATWSPTAIVVDRGAAFGAAGTF